jgi:hypothetical protein
MPLAALLLLAAAPAAGHCDRGHRHGGRQLRTGGVRRQSAAPLQPRRRHPRAVRLGRPALCFAGALRPADLARFRKLIVQNGEGATEPVLYQDPSMAPDMFIFQYAFQNGGPSPPKAFESALRCWKTPERASRYQD